MRGTGLAAVIVAIAVTALALGGCGGDSNDAGSEETPAVKRPSANPPEYHQTEYDAFTTWKQEVSDKKVGSYLESVWHDPASVSYKMAIDSRPAAGAPPPLAAAELARAQVNHLQGYRERNLKRVKLGKQPAVRWSYDLGEESHVAYFLEKCGTSIVFSGPVPLVSYEAFSEFYGVVVSKIKPVCNE